MAAAETMKPVPLAFAEDRHDAIWGYERWLVSVHPSAPSVVRGGPYDGRRLDDLTSVFGAELLGTRAHGRFPLLFKEIAARLDLSVQVHPNETTCRATGGEPKTEAWHVLAAEPGGTLFAGLRQGVTAERFSAAIAEGGCEDLLQRIAAVPGETVFVPGGLVHSIGAGVRLFEVQQSSDTTYRLYDWGRTGKDGRPRPLHVREGLTAADLAAQPVVVHGDFTCPFFSIRPLTLDEAFALSADPGSFRVLFAASGRFSLVSEGSAMIVEEGGAVLMPAVVSAEVVPAVPGARLLLASLG